MKFTISRLAASLRKRGLAGMLTWISSDIATALKRRMAYLRDHAGASEFLGQPAGHKQVTVILAGYKPRLWPLTLKRVRAFAPKDMDICVVTAGKRVSELAELCGKYGWSYLSTSKNKTGLALNKAIERHPEAKWIFKLDEDIFVTRNFFESMLDGYERVVSSGDFEPGFCAPTINVNGVTYKHFLQTIQQEREYLQRFGTTRIACGGIPTHHDPEAALWLWQRSLPIDDVAERFASTYAGTDDNFSLIGTRFSIGAILFNREFFEQIGGFVSSWREGLLGVDESNICRACVEASRPMIYLKNTFVGHFSFYPQEQRMLESWAELETMDPSCFGVLENLQ